MKEWSTQEGVEKQQSKGMVAQEGVEKQQSKGMVAQEGVEKQQSKGMVAQERVEKQQSKGIGSTRGSGEEEYLEVSSATWSRAAEIWRNEVA